MTDLQAAPRRAGADQGDDLHHIYCCNPDNSLCGTNISTYDHIEEPEDANCVVCLDLEEQPCPTCGE